MVGFTGSRSLPAYYQFLVSQVVRHFAGQPVAVGCASGADQFVRQATPNAHVFHASSFSGLARARLARRSTAMVQAVAASVSPQVIGFVSQPCPASLVPSPSPSACFRGLGSGSWASLALAAGLGVPATVFWCSSQPVQLPAWGAWQPVNLAGCTGWQLQPAVTQPPLF